MPISVHVPLLHLERDPFTGSMLRNLVNFPSALCRRRSGTFMAVAHLAASGLSRVPVLRWVICAENLTRQDGQHTACASD